MSLNIVRARKKLWCFLCLAGLYGCYGNPTQANAANIIIDHTNWDWIQTQPQAVSDSIAARKMFFAHASVGDNVMSGMEDLHGSDSDRYPLARSSDDGTPPATTVNGTLYDYNRGNPSWSQKVTDFTAYIGNGWHAPAVDFAMNKFCYIDQTADWTVYRDAMLSLEAAYPSTRFIYWTMPLMTSSDYDETLRSQYNTNLRNWVASQDGKLLFDIADIEAWNASGVHQTFLYNGTSYERMESTFSSDGGHLNQTGYDRVATGLYSLLGMAASGGVASLTLTPTPTPSGTATPTPTRTLSRTATPTRTPTSSETVTPTAELTLSATATITPGSTPGQTAVNSPVPTLTFTATTVSTLTPTPTPSTSRTGDAGQILRAYPNPGKDRIYLTLPKIDHAGSVRLVICNTAGETVSILRREVNQGFSEPVVWECGTTAPGIYFVTAFLDQQELGKQKVAVWH